MPAFGGRLSDEEIADVAGGIWYFCQRNWIVWIVSDGDVAGDATVEAEDEAPTKLMAEAPTSSATSARLARSSLHRWHSSFRILLLNASGSLRSIVFRPSQQL